MAYGTDIAQAQRLMLDAVRSNPDVQRWPAASVYFTGFGESSLDFEIRAFVAPRPEATPAPQGLMWRRAEPDHIRAASGPGPSDSAGGSGPRGSGPHPA